MAKRLSFEQMAVYASQAGFRGEALRNIVAIAMAESGGRIDAVGDGGNSVSLVQVHLPSHGQYDRQRLLTDPAYAFKAAFEISGGGKNFNPWTTWSHATEAGRKHNAQQYLNQAAKAVQGVEGAMNVGGSIDLTPMNDGGTGGSTASTGTVSATSAPAMVTDEITPESSAEDIEAYIRKNYPAFAPFWNNEEIREVLSRPDIDELGDYEIEQLLRNTEYWRTHGVHSRRFDAYIAEAPSEAGGLVSRTIGLVQDAFARAGYPIDTGVAGTVAKNAIRSGWIDLTGQIVDQRSLDDFLAWSIRVNQVELGPGQITADVARLKQIAKQFYVPMTEGDLQDWALRILEGTADEATFTEHIKDQSRGRFINNPDILNGIDKGLTPDLLLRPARNTIAEILELDPETVDFMGSTKYSDALYTYDDKLGTRVRTPGEIAQWARDQDEYKNTRTYKEQDANFGANIASLFGKVAF